MRTFFKIAWRNIWRNTHRSLITISAISIGLVALLFLRAYVDGAHMQMIKNYTELVSGSAQIHRNGFHKKMGLERSITDEDGLEAVLSSVPDLAAYTKRVKEFVLLGSTEQSAGIVLVGVDPVQEKKVTNLHKRVRQGTFLPERGDDQIVLGKDLLEILNVKVGDKVVVMGQGADGSLVSGAYHVCGVLDTGTEEIDKGVGIISLAAAQDLFVLGTKVSEYAVRATDVNKILDMAKNLKEKVDPKVFEVLPWQEISPILEQTIQFDDAFVAIIYLIMITVTAIGILNTILMGVLERTREFGVMLALGTQRRQVVLMVAIESFLLSSVGIVVGVVSGTLLSFYFEKYGINLSMISKALESWYVGSVVYPHLFPTHIFYSVILVLLVSVCVSVYPAWRASQLQPREALRHF